MVAGTLSRAGYFMGDNLLPPNDDNPKGYFEDYEINAINEDLLDQVVPKRVRFLGREYFRYRPLRRQRWVACLPVGIEIPCPAELAQRMQRASLKEPYCFKDPRFCYTLPLWRPYLRHVAFIVVFREPAKTAVSILKACQHAPITMTFRRALQVWTQMYKHILEIHRYHGDWLFLHYTQLIRGNGLHRLEMFLEAQVDHSFPDASLNRSFSSERISKETERVYQTLCELAG
jgi:hypothetical protein